MKNRIALTICCLQIFSVGILAQLSFEAERALQAAYAGDSSALVDTVQAINRAPFPTDAYRKVALVQAYAASEKVEHLAEARRIAEQYITEAATGWTKDFVRIQLSMVLSLQGNRKDGSALAEHILSDVDLESFSSVDDPLLDFISKRVGISSKQIPTYIKDNLLREIGSYYLNRSTVEGGPDLQKAANHFGAIVASGLRESAMADQRLKGINPVALETSGSARAVPGERAINPGTSVAPLEGPKDLPHTPPMSPSGALADRQKDILPSDEPTSSTPWSIIVVVIVAAIGLLWLLVNKRK